jgi:hypothetical protein
MFSASIVPGIIQRKYTIRYLFSVFTYLHKGFFFTDSCSKQRFPHSYYIPTTSTECVVVDTRDFYCATLTVVETEGSCVRY